MARGRPDRPHQGREAEEPGPRGVPRDAEDIDPDRGPEGERHDSDSAELVERDEGAHAEQTTDEANLRADDSPPGT